MKILAIETSCDETAAAVIEGVAVTKPVRILSNVVASSEEMHRQTGGIVPEVASREQLKAIIPVLDQALAEARISKSEIRNKIDAVAVTVGPGLIGSLLVGVETARALAYAWNKPLIPVNHLVAHLYANWVGAVPELPAVGLVVSGGHTELVLMKDHGKLELLGRTRDDAAGECFDKCARLLGLPYPGGPAIAAAAAKILKRSDLVGKQQSPTLPRPLIRENTYDFSFSGLKTALRLASLAQGKPRELAHEVQEAIVEVLVERVVRAVEEFRPRSVLLGGGVAANLRLREELDHRCQMLDLRLFIPPKELCTDNAVMIGAAAFYNYSPIPWQKVKANPGLEIV
ncbi:MAG: tRNA (adenosine(37)-N6)-threonylcarbamoyltransferase complex transferase subunit TsaD [Candidatus Chisholmbacteria bacterium RIFCSPHIGHO2_01_FULL_48_12]|uniref:tRNA N6-adenosine threonylcarbamoyltransferase n=1 Tax=Candidatus Chisholmbacteria bacterium RIFCSPHIGHO2_01_FULL_48_12 TaxID=1797589 RepID=A0A1G1VKV1_9BACT|nr:MAG: tRNA (adenosine(37)-N6)-threonylcarbamoyltransferase complex transferase subunit TsaD [Candidatus Chisholmbacteria bacterium RIFCSPHIGHO2_01_FULL_48_12]